MLHHDIKWDFYKLNQLCTIQVPLTKIEHMHISERHQFIFKILLTPEALCFLISHSYAFPASKLKLTRPLLHLFQKTGYLLQVFKASSSFLPTNAASYFFIPLILLSYMVEQPFTSCFLALWQLNLCQKELARRSDVSLRDN